MNAKEEGDEHKEERQGVCQYACPKPLSHGTAQGDAVAYVKSGVVALDLNHLLLALAAAAELTRATSAASRRLQDAHTAAIRSDTLDDSFVTDGLSLAHYVFKFMQRYTFPRNIPNYLLKDFTFLHKNTHLNAYLRPNRVAFLDVYLMWTRYSERRCLPSEKAENS